MGKLSLCVCKGQKMWVEEEWFVEWGKAAASAVQVCGRAGPWRQNTGQLGNESTGQLGNAVLMIQDEKK